MSECKTCVIVGEAIKEMQIFTILPLEYSQRSAIGQWVQKIIVEVLIMLNSDLLSDLKNVINLIFCQNCNIMYLTPNM